jgi:ABC-type transporter Mla subunit MlaD
VIVVVTTSSGGGDPPYQVRAIFDDASFAVPGEDVRVAGANVGTIGSLDVTNQSGLGGANSCKQQNGTCKAAVTMTIGTKGFTPFRQNAHCAIRPQSLIGEKYVDCDPGTSAAQPLNKIDSGPGAGTYLLPVTHTTSPIDTDLVQNIYREPVRQQFSLILNELGTGLAARGSDLNAVIRRANPALKDTDTVLKILAHENHQLAQLATDSKTVLTPLAQVRHQIADFVIQANRTSVASAARAVDTARSFQLLPTFLRQARPLLADLGHLADQGTPLFRVLSTAGPDLAAQYEALAPFARETRASLIALGASAVKQKPALLATIPLDKRLENLATATLPTARLLNQLLGSLDKTGGYQQLMKVIFNTVAATNGFDQTGHYLRTEALVGGCSSYAKIQVPGCGATFGIPGAAADLPAAPARATLASHNTRAPGNKPAAPKNTPAAQDTPKGRVARSVHHPHQQQSAATLSRLVRYLIGGHT